MKRPHHDPPQWIEEVLYRLLTPRQAEVSLGDLVEKYHYRVNKGMRVWKAKMLYIVEGIGFIRMAGKIRQQQANSTDMLRNYFTIAWRSLIKERGYTLINLASVSIAIALMSLVTLYVQQELSFDRFHENADRIFRASRTTYNMDGGIDEHDPYLPAPLGPALASAYPQVSAYSRFMSSAFLIRSNDNLFQERGAYIDSSFLKMFAFPMAQGDPFKALSDKHHLIVSEKLAGKLFAPGVDPVGKTIEINLDGTYQPFIIGGIIRDVPDNSTLRFDLLLRTDLFLQSERGRTVADNWYSSFLETYFLLDQPSSVTTLSDQMLTFRRTHYPDEVRRMIQDKRWQDSTKAPVTYHFQNLADIHNDVGFPNSVDPRKYYNLGGIAVMVLLLGCFNFMLLSVGKARSRALEIGMRKTLGATRSQVVAQFWSESILTSLAGMFIGIGLIYLTVPLFNEVVQTSLRFEDIMQPLNLLWIVGISLITGLAAGWYPAMYLSRFKPVTVMQGRSGMKTSLFSKSLITVQFGVSVFFIVLAMIVTLQLSYVKNHDLGIATEGVVCLSARGAAPEKVELFKEQIRSYTFVQGVSSLRFRFPLYSNEGWSYDGQDYKAYLLDADKDFTSIFDIELVQGSGFQKSEADTSNVILINESLSRAFGNDLVGKKLPGFNRGSTVIGVVKDFNFQSLENEIRPIIISVNPVVRGTMRPRTNVLVKMDLAHTKENIGMLENAWKTNLSEIPFAYSFLRDDLNAEYAGHERWSMVVLCASCMAVFIACLGLVGFSTMFVNNRLKEIGVRKVMGGSSVGIFGFFSLQFLKLVAIGALLSLPVAWYQGHQWLEGFAFRFDLGWQVFAAGLLVSVGLAFVVVSYMLLRISNLNPVTTLRNE